MARLDLPSAQEIADDVNFTEADLKDNMIRQPSLVAHYGRIAAEAQFRADTAKQLLEIAEAKTAQQMREEAADEGKKITESEIKSTLPTRRNVAEKRSDYNRAKADAEGMKIVVESLRHKKDMMIQIGVAHRTELENKIRGLIKEGKESEAIAEINRYRDKQKAA